MSARETPITRAYWRYVGGTLVEEFPVVPRTTHQGPRLLDAIILPDGPHEIAHWRDVSVEGKHVICVQTKDSRLGMYLMGQARYSPMLLAPFRPASVRSVALCTRDDAALRPLAEADGIEVVVWNSGPE